MRSPSVTKVRARVQRRPAELSARCAVVRDEQRIANKDRVADDNVTHADACPGLMHHADFKLRDAEDVSIDKRVFEPGSAAR